jgi:hypothetical protein
MDVSFRRRSSRPTGVRRAIGMVALAAMVPFAHGFAGEDMLLGNPWHHWEISYLAAKACGFAGPDYASGIKLSEGQLAPSPANAVAWHADYIDSYLYNPLWWAQGGLSRMKASFSTQGELAKMHFDDLFSGDHVRRAWRNYLTGTMVGLLWAKERNDIHAARNILGVSLHAIQDFYSHSNWIDDATRRGAGNPNWEESANGMTWFAMSAAAKSQGNFWTGAYEHPAHTGVLHHGKYAPSCTALRTSAVSALLDVGCAAFSPLSNTHLCKTFKDCKAGVQVPAGGSVLSVALPGNVVYQNPPGIALDNTWLANIGVKTRNLNGVTGAQAFGAAKKLAFDSSVQWLQILEAQMEKVDGKQFWTRVKTELRSGSPPLEQEYERFDKFPYQFVSSGKYPTVPSEAEHQYYLRVRLKTSQDANSGTDSDIYLRVPGSDPVLLDYMPKANPALAYNDFERGDNDVYLAGPFAQFPTSISLENRSASAVDVLTSIGTSFSNAMTTLASTLKNALLSIIGGHADYIQSSRKMWQPADLQRITSAGENFEVVLNGGDEGHYKVHGTIRKTGQNTVPNVHPADDWHEFSITLTRIDCVKESTWDRGSFSDEPFIVALLVPLPGTQQKFLSRVFADMDTGENQPVGHIFTSVRVPKAYGMISVPILAMESDDESSNDRSEIRDKFANESVAKIDPTQRTFTQALGAAIAADWKVEEMEVQAFGKGGKVEYGVVFNQRINRWIKGKEIVPFALNRAGMVDFGISASALENLNNFQILPGTIRPPIRIPPPLLVLVARANEVPGHPATGLPIVMGCRSDH